MKKSDLSDLLRDDEFIEKYIFADPYIWGKFKTALLKEMIEAQPPATLRGGGTQMRTPVYKPKNLDEAAQMTQNYLAKK